ncbi:MAG: transposase [Deltaproteobacteria bacterium]|nr:transposase [Deltaproteobacteria bacterium]
MARPLRVEFEGAYYHVMHRGNGSENIFLNTRDREKFFEYLSKATERYSIVIHTYCLMTNHYHLILETPHANLSQAIKWINVSYATYFNRKHDRHGHLFQGRFKAIIIDADVYLKPLSRYIHLNPLRGGITKSLDDYKWSSYGAYSGKDKAPDWLEVDWLLSLFGKPKRMAFNKYREYVESADPHKIKNPERDTLGGLILGTREFTDRVKKLFLSKREDAKEVPQLKGLKPTVTPAKIVKVVSRKFNSKTESIIQKSRKGNLARDIAIYLARELTGEYGVNLGLYFGGISGAGITLRTTHVENLIQQDNGLKNRIARLKSEIISVHPEIG